MDINEIKDKRIAVLLSGGVDSSVVVWEFARLGLHPDCFYIKIGPEEKEEWDCSSEEDLEMATAVARKYGCKLEVVDCHKEYWNEVTRYTMDKVKAGYTPNTDVMCHRALCADRDGREWRQMACNESRPREGPDRLLGSDRELAIEKSDFPYRPSHQK